MDDLYSKTLAYVIGIALGDGNLSNPNGRAIRLRITCDSKYPKIGEEMQEALRVIFPKNKVSIAYAKPATSFNISVYSNTLADLLPWKVGEGTKAQQTAHVPDWILENTEYTKECLRGLIQTDGCIYIDRGYKMINFVNYTKLLVQNVQDMLTKLGFRSTFSAIKLSGDRYRYSIRVTRDVENLIQTISLYKA